MKLKLCDFFFCLLVRFVYFLLHVKNNKKNIDIYGVNLPYDYIYRVCRGIEIES